MVFGLEWNNACMYFQSTKAADIPERQVHAGHLCVNFRGWLQQRIACALVSDFAGISCTLRVSGLQQWSFRSKDFDCNCWDQERKPILKVWEFQEFSVAGWNNGTTEKWPPPAMIKCVPTLTLKAILYSDTCLCVCETFVLKLIARKYAFDLFVCTWIALSTLHDQL